MDCDQVQYSIIVKTEKECKEKCNHPSKHTPHINVTYESYRTGVTTCTVHGIFDQYTVYSSDLLPCNSLRPF